MLFTGYSVFVYLLDWGIKWCYLLGIGNLYIY